MSGNKPLYLLLLLIPLLLLLTLPPWAWAEPWLAPFQPKGTVGSVLAVSGEGFSPKSKVTLQLEGQGKSLQLAQLQTDERGSFYAEVALPKVRGGEYKVVATDERGKRAEAPFTVSPKIERLRSLPDGKVVKVALEGTLLVLEGSGGMEGLLVAIDNRPAAGEPMVLADGSFYYEFFAVGSPGLHVIALHDGKGRILSSTFFTILPASYHASYANSSSTSPQLSDLFRQLSQLAADLDANTSLIRQDLEELRQLLNSTSSELGGNIAESRARLQSLIQSLVSALQEDTASLQERLEEGLDELVEELERLRGEMVSLGEGVGGVRQEVVQGSSLLQGRIAAVEGRLEELDDGISGQLGILGQEIRRLEGMLSDRIEEASSSLSSMMVTTSDQLQALIIIGIVVSSIGILTRFIRRGP